MRGPGTAPAPAVPVLGDGFCLQLVEALATRWGADHTEGTHLWFEVDALRATG